MPSVLVNQSVYYRKSVLGDNRVRDGQDLPVQLVQPNGNIQLGLPQNVLVASSVSSDNVNNVVIVSGPEKFAVDIHVRDSLSLAIVCLGLVNIILTSLLFGDASFVDPSKVIPIGGTYQISYLYPNNHAMY
jgi:hypothetical protein